MRRMAKIDFALMSKFAQIGVMRVVPLGGTEWRLPAKSWTGGKQILRIAGWFRGYEQGHVRRGTPRYAEAS